MYANKIQFDRLSDEDLMDYLQHGFEEALTILVERYQQRIHNYIYRFTHNHQDSEDLVQETFMRVYKCCHTYQRIAKFSTWVYTIAGNLAKTHFRKSKRMQLVYLNVNSNADDELQTTNDIADSRITPDRELENNMIIENIQKALDELSEDFKQMVIMRDLQELSYEEIMEITGLPMGTVKSRINRARIKLQEILSFYKNHETI